MKKLFTLMLAASLLLVSCGAPKDGSLPRKKASAKMEKAFAEYIAATKDAEEDIHSVMVLQHGKVLAETWMGEGAPETPHVLFSVSKTFTSTAVGFAIEEGLLKLDDKVISFFPDKLPAEVNDNLAAMTIRDLLTMNTGHDTEPRMSRTDPDSDWVKSFLEWPVTHVPGTYFVYNSYATFTLSAIITKLTGQAVVDYLQPRLFDPLAIEHPRWDANHGVNFGGWGLYLKTEDMAKMGQCILNGGKYNGKQVIPAAWVKQMTARQVDSVPAGMRPEAAAGNGLTVENSDWVQGYCYQMWRCRHNAVRADGAWGQFIIVIPDKDAVVVVTAHLEDMQKEIDLIWDNLYPAL
ncbi:MAG: serine hydrolase [Bacteroidales bacterium]|nr:serine hydrolase [Bacteroidales bacterium]MBP5389982.1 serine hydrolase [Bacteroidales bacterium]